MKPPLVKGFYNTLEGNAQSSKYKCESRWMLCTGDGPSMSRTNELQVVCGYCHLRVECDIGSSY